MVGVVVPLAVDVVVECVVVDAGVLHVGSGVVTGSRLQGADALHERVAVDILTPLTVDVVLLVGLCRIVPAVHPYVVEDVVVQLLIRGRMATNHTPWRL